VKQIELSLKIRELVEKHGFSLPPGLCCVLRPTLKNPAELAKRIDGVDYFWFMRELDAENHETPIPHQWAEKICAMDLLKAMQSRRPELLTTIDGDWLFKTNSGAPAPAIHWDRLPHEMIIEATHAYCTKNQARLDLSI